MEQKQSSNFRAILNAALNQNNRALQAILDRGVCIDEPQVGCLYSSPASQLAKEGRFKAVTWLINKGANINWIARGAAWGGHREYAEELLGRGADINWIALGAALGGYREYCEELLGRGADINWIAYGAALGGHVNSSIDSQLRWLAFSNQQHIINYASAFSSLDQSVNISKETQRRAIDMSSYIRRQLLPMNYSQALVRSDYRSEEVLHLLMLTVMMPNKLGDFCKLDNNVMLHTLSFLLPSGMTLGNIKQLGFFMGRAYLGAQLHCYLGNHLIHHRARAESFLQAVYRTFDKESLNTLINQQGQLLNGNNQYPAEVQEHEHKRNVQNPSIDRFHEIIFLWTDPTRTTSAPQAGPVRLLAHEKVQEKEGSSQDGQDSTPAPALFQPVVPTRGRRQPEPTQVCCVMQ